MTATIIQSNEQSTCWLPEESHAKGPDAEKIRVALSNVRPRLDEAQTRGAAARAALLNDVVSLFKEASRPGWDGYQARPIGGETVENVLTFIELLPPDMPKPELVPEPDGEIALEWHRSSSWVLSISIGPRNRLAYAGLFGLNKSYGAEEWHTAIPRMVTEAMRRYMAANSSPP